MKKRVLFSLLALLCAVVMLTFPISGDELSGECGENLTWTFKDGTLTISGTGGMWYYPRDVVVDGEEIRLEIPWNDFRDQIKTVIVEDGVTDFFDNVFRDCTALTEVQMADSVTRLGAATFNGCTSLQTIKLPDSITYLGGASFAGCTKLEKVELPAGLWQIDSNMFNGCTALTEVVIPEWIKEIGSFAFSNCTNLTKVVFHDNVRAFRQSVFAGCTKLKILLLPKNLQEVRGDSFIDCPNLQALIFTGDVPAQSPYLIFDPMYTTIYYPTYGKGWDEFPAKMYGSGGVWVAVDDPYAVEVPEEDNPPYGICGPTATWSYENGKLTISGSGFIQVNRWSQYGDEIKEVVIEGEITDIVDYAFENFVNLTSITMPDSVAYLGGSAFAGCTSLEEVTLPSGIRSIPFSTFENCTALKSIVIPDGVTSIGVAAFKNCTALESVTMPSQLETIRNEAFAECTALKTITFPEKVQYINSNAFLNCTSLKTMYFLGDVPNVSYSTFKGVTATAYYPADNETWLKGTLGRHGGTIMEVPNTDQDQEVVRYCGENLTWTYKDGVLTITGTGDMFAYGDDSTPNWSNLKGEVKKIVIEKGATNVSSCAFYGFTALEEVVIPDTVTIIDDMAFTDCAKLAKVKIPDPVTRIGEGAFDGCTSLTEVHIGKGVTLIRKDAFKNCTALKKIYFYGDMPTMMGNSFRNVNATAYYPGSNSTWEKNAMEEAVSYAQGHFTWVANCSDGHSYGDWVTVKEPTEDEEGRKEKTCSVCGDVKSKSIDKLEPAPTDPPATEPPATEPPATEPPATEPPATEPPATEPPATEPPATEPAPTAPAQTEPKPTAPAPDPIDPTPADPDGTPWGIIAVVIALVLAAGASFVVLKKKK